MELMNARESFHRREAPLIFEEFVNQGFDIRDITRHRRILEALGHLPLGD